VEQVVTLPALQAVPVPVVATPLPNQRIQAQPTSRASDHRSISFRFIISHKCIQNQHHKNSE